MHPPITLMPCGGWGRRSSTVAAGGCPASSPA